MKKIVCFHIVNDVSGGTKMLATLLDELLSRKIKIDLITSSGGVLDNLAEKYSENLRLYHFPYSYSKSRVKHLLSNVYAQIYIFFFAFRYISEKKTFFYINTVKPFAAALAGKIIGKKVLYHYHENAFLLNRFYRFLYKIMLYVADKIICVSEYQHHFLSHKKNVMLVPNALPQDFRQNFDDNFKRNFEKQNVLLFSNLRFFKGMLEFIELARRLPQYSFELVIGETRNDIRTFFFKHKIDNLPENLTITARQFDVIPAYQRASLVLNLSDKNKFIETFGLTALEAMTAGLPVIVPTVGGITEMVADGINGYKTDVQELDKIEIQVVTILEDFNLYKKLSHNSWKISKKYDIHFTINKLLSILN